MTDFFNIVPSVIAGQEIGMKAFKMSGDADQQQAQTEALKENTFEKKDAYDQILQQRFDIANNYKQPQANSPVGTVGGQPTMGEQFVDPRAQRASERGLPLQSAQAAPQIQTPQVQGNTNSLGALVGNKNPQGGSNVTGTIPAPNSLSGLATQPQSQAIPAVAQPNQQDYNFPNVRPMDKYPSVQAKTSYQPENLQPLQPSNRPELANNGLPLTGNPQYDTAQAKMPIDNPKDLSSKGYDNHADKAIVNTFNTASTASVLDKVPSPPDRIDTPYGSLDVKGAMGDMLARGDIDGAEHLRTIAMKAGLDSEKIKIEQRMTQNGILHGAVSALDYFPKDQRDAEYQKLKPQLIASGIDPKMLPDKWTDTTYDDNGNVVEAGTKDKIAMQTLSAKDQLAEQHKLAKDRADAIKAEAAKTRAEKEAVAKPGELREMTGNQGPGLYRINPDPSIAPIKVGDLKPEKAAKPTTDEKLEALAGKDWSQPLPIPAHEEAARQIADGDKDAQSLTARFGAVIAAQIQSRALNMAEKAGQELPTETDRLERKKAITAIAPGGIVNKNVTNMKTMAGHAADAMDLIKKMNNKDTQGINKLVNFYKTQTGDPSITNAQTLLTFLTHEAAKMAKGEGALNKEEIAAVEKGMPLFGSPAQLQGALGKLLSVAGSRISANQENYESAKPGHSIGEMLDTRTRELFKQNGIVLPAPQRPLKPSEQLKANKVKQQDTSQAPTGVSIGQVPHKSDGSILPDGQYKGFTVKDGKVATVGGQ